MTEAQLSRLRECLSSTARHLSDAAYELEMFAHELPKFAVSKKRVSKKRVSKQRVPALTLQKLIQPLAELELSVRSLNCLKRAEIETVADLIEMSPTDFRQIRHFGHRSRNEVNDVLENLGFDRK